MNKLKIVAILVGIDLTYSMYNWITFLYKVFVGKSFAATTYSIWFVIAVSFFGLGAYLQFVSTRFMRSQLLRLFLFYQCFSSLIWLTNMFLLYVRNETNIFSGSIGFLQMLGLTLLFGAMNFISLIFLSSVRVPKYETYNDGESNGLTFSPLSKSLRFAHRLLDLVFLVAVFANNISFLYGRLDNNLVFAIIELLLIFSYYFIMEAIFKVTFGKIITQSVVVDEQGMKAGVWYVLKRTLCRLIPFDALSFLFSDRGWHDQLSGTYVIHDKYEWEKDEDDFDTYFTGEPELEPTTTLLP